jgi:multiple sugar transport system permease protein
MKRRAFIGFVAPSLAMMIVFIALPLAAVFVQSFFLTQQVFEEAKIETCTPGFLQQKCVVEVKKRPLLGADGKPMTETAFVGLENYRLILEPGAVAKAFSAQGQGLSDVLKIDFYRALRFTLTFCLGTLPLVLIFGLGIALAVNNTLAAIRGPVIFVSLLPFIITPVIGALSIRWLFIGDGILTDLLEWLLGHPVSMFAQGWTIELLMLFYRVWSVTPFAFIVFYAALQTVDRDTLESAVVDGASRFERLRFVIVPHLMPLIVFVALIHLMDSYRVFEEVIGFSSEAHRISLQWLTFHFLVPDDSGNRSIARAAASSMLTMIGIIVLLVPILMRNRRVYRRPA